MYEFLKWVWSILLIFTVIGLMSMLPYEKYQRAYFKELNDIRTYPQKRIDATYRYIEAVENGYEEAIDGISTEPPKKYFIDDEETSETPSQTEKPQEQPKKYSKPKFIRDKLNPKIWYRVKD